MRFTKFPVQKDPRTPMATHGFIDVAKIEGSEEYKNYMLGLQKEPVTLDSPKFCPFPAGACQYWPIRTLQPVNPLAPMLKALVLAAESTLQTKINSAAVTAYDLRVVDRDSTKQLVTSALDKIGIESHDFIDDAVPSVIRALGIPDYKCSPGEYTPSGDSNFRKHPGKLVLSVDYSRNSLTSSLWKVECKVIEQQDRKYSSDGYDIFKYAQRSPDNTLRMENKMKSHLNSTCGNSRRRHRDNPNAVLSDQKGLGFVLDYESIGGMAVQDNIDAVLLMGEKAGDEKMQASLKEVLTTQFVNGASVDILQAEDLSPDPAFVGARGVAWNERNIQLDLNWKRKMEICARYPGRGCRG